MKKIITLSLTALFLGVAVYAQVPRKVLVEDFTGEWCGWCPLGRTTCEHLEATFGNQIIDMGQHYGDNLACTYSNGLSAYDSYGYPGFMIDRTQFSGHLWQAVGYSGMDVDSQVQQDLNTTSPVGVGITSTYNAATRALSVTVYANFAVAQTGTMRISCALTEDSISTPGVQNNYMNTDNTAPWYNQGDPIAVYYQRNTVRYGMSAVLGDVNSIPTTGVQANSSYSKTYNYTLPAGWNASHMHIVGMVSHFAVINSAVDTTHIDVMNANIARLGESVTGMEELTSNVTTHDIYPNPSSGTVTLPLTLSNAVNVSVKIYDITGRNVITLSNGLLSEGDHLLRWDATDESGAAVSDGVYFCQIQSGEVNVTKRIVISR